MAKSSKNKTKMWRKAGIGRQNRYIQAPPFPHPLVAKLLSTVIPKQEQSTVE